MLKIIKDEDDFLEVTNEIVTLKFIKTGKSKGQYEISHRDITERIYYLKECYSCINIYSREEPPLEEYSSTDFDFDSNIEDFNDEFGEGFKIILSPMENSNYSLTYTIQFKIYEDYDFILVKLINIEEKSEASTSIHSISPLTIKNSNLWLSDNAQPTDLYHISWFKNGWQSWSACKVLFGNEKDIKGPPIKLIKRVMDNQDYVIKGRFYSEYCTVITDLLSESSVILGFVTLKDQFSRIILDYENNKDLKLLTAFGCMDGVNLKNSSINTSEELFICFKTNRLGYYGLIDYAKVINKLLKIQETRITEVPIGWCSWYYYFTKITQEDMIKNYEFFKKNKDHLPIDFIQLDDGYFETIGDYNIVNSKFSNGLTWLYEKITKSKFKGGIWTAPFLGVKTSEIFKKKPHWFIKKRGTKRMLKAHFNPGWSKTQFEYALDLSNPDVIEYLEDFFFKLSFAFGDRKLIDFFKIDFLHGSVPFDGDFKDITLTRAQMYYNGVKAIRDGITDESFLLGCGAPLGPCVGLVDAMRIGTDTAPYWKLIDSIGEKYSVAVPSLKRGLLPVLYRSFMHKYFWINDPDCLMLRRTDTKLNLDEIKLQLTIFGLSGGQLLISDDMIKLTEEEIEDAKLVIPPFNTDYSDATPTDILFSKNPSIFMIQTKEDIGKRYLVALINWEDKPKSESMSIEEMILTLTQDEEEFYVYDFWNRKFLGVFAKYEKITFSNMIPHSCVYLSIIPKEVGSEDDPIFLSSTLHITQGCSEITEFDYDDESDKISVIIDLIGNRKGFLYLKLPKSKKISTDQSKFQVVDEINNIWELYVEFKDIAELQIELK